ncbi:ATP-binding protein [Pectobacterium atrosepticum]|uniref:ATP-binding protein n=1 Tax=Pectobacterium atrosepticum TaxID=29471 RepID=UPI0003A8E5AC|nr:ATP-binding protein [Pectobacterium atrosepticum]GKV85440.1 sensor histidine kinase [Pectobacterium carotovorum subsp. carotovorum]AIA69783.1 histidine kinase [Pectobacterium atrosepticum]AIK12694.1 integral membrane sensor signal transduction histidine kinase [Pectobacterium atrosepticum]ATY89703.1 two-component sensor histidine kinase [Pectobacterium atrosepticum]KFX10946.1 histidine kinase [Pectobacterium atrosepticum]
MMIRGRLFWKILLGFWLTFLVISQLLWLAFSLGGDRHKPLEEIVVSRIATMQAEMVAAALQHGGLGELNDVMSLLPEKEQQYISITESPLPLSEQELVSSPQNALLDDAFTPDKRGAQRATYVIKQVSGPAGKWYQIRYDAELLRSEFRPPRPVEFLNVPAPFVIIAGFGGLLFSSVLAWSLARPLNQIRAGFDQVAQGDLNVRLLPVMRKRHDEISDVARDFDSMVERLDSLASAREQLLHDVSHELRSPLARLQLAIGLVRQNPDNLENSLQRIEREALLMDKMIGELLTLSRTENSGVEEAYFDLLGLVTAVVNDTRYEAQVTGVEILLVADEDDDYTIKGNAELMRRAVDNVMRNALRFSAPAQQVAVSLIGNEQEWTIQVADQGPGVEKSKLSSIFDPFIRVDSPLSGKGYGLGLAIARKVVLAHGGHIEADNGEPCGLVIRLCVPRWKA